MANSTSHPDEPKWGKYIPYEAVIEEKVESHTTAHFRTKAHCDGPLVDTLIEVDRTLGIVKVKPVGGRIWRTLPLQQVAEMVYARATKEAMGMKRGGAK